MKVAEQKTALTALNKVDPLASLTAESKNPLFAVKAQFTKENIETVMNWFEKRKAEATALRDSRKQEQEKAGMGLLLNE